MKKMLLGGVALLTLGSVAVAADLNVYPKAPVAAPIAVPLWYGGYFGLGIGYGVDITGLSVGGLDLGTQPRGFTGGARLGYDWNLGPFVFGAVVDINGADFSTCNDMLLACAKTNWWGTANARLGIPFGNWMPYLVGGGAYGQRNATNPIFSIKDTGVGWDAGGGLEGKIPGTALSLFWETKYVNLGGVSAAGLPVSQDFHFLTSMVGVNYHF